MAKTQPTVAQAAAFILQSRTLDYRRQCLAFWRERWGNGFADKVEAEVKARWGK